MKEYISELIRPCSTPEEGVKVCREYLQARILGCLQRVGAMIPLAFHGGTALRFLYGIPRFSEDLDFALARDNSRYDFSSYVHALRSEFAAEGYDVEFKVKDQRVVQSAFVRFRGLLHEVGLSPQKGQVFSVKIEVDTRPPAGARLETSVVRRHVLLQLQHHDKGTLLAGKLHAVLQRSYLKGRDIYDLVWYLSDSSWPGPNLTYLNNALCQSDWTGPQLTPDSWREAVLQRTSEMPWDRVVQDVRPFLASPGDVNVIDLENVKKLLSGHER